MAVAERRLPWRSATTFSVASNRLLHARMHSLTIFGTGFSADQYSGSNVVNMGPYPCTVSIGHGQSAGRISNLVWHVRQGQMAVGISNPVWPPASRATHCSPLQTTGTAHAQ